MEERKQIAALPIRFNAKGKVEVLLVTSRDTGRWVPPKGWPMDGHKPWSAAKIEALEEAGAIGTISDEPLGVYRYGKLLDDGSTVRCKVALYPMIVTKLMARWKERKQRKRHWFSVKKAASSVEEHDLRALILELNDRSAVPKSLISEQGLRNNGSNQR